MPILGVVASSKAKGPSVVDYLVVAGGGSGGAGNSQGGGGAGGFRTGTDLSIPNSFTVTVGAGGAAVRPYSSNGFDSVLATITSAGGGGGGGGGSTEAPGAFGGQGGSGIVIIKYPGTFADLTIGPGLTYTKTTPSGFKVFTFTAGTDTVSA